MNREYTGNEIAIIGIACRFPQSPDWRLFWRNLLEGRELVSFFSRDALLATGVPAELVDLPNYVPAKAVLDDADCFDHSFFGYSQREAQKMDPQLRALHEVCYNALRDAGIQPGSAPLNAGVFLGSTLDMQRLQQFGGASGDIAEMFDVGNYNDPAAFATQIAYRMKLNGPAVHVQTACSTSLSAVHLASKALLAGECSMALAGGACVTEPVAGGYLYQDGMILSPDGHCKTFADEGQGTVNGNGAGVVLLKLLDDALADGDPIHAVIVESAMNNDADRKVSFEAPSVQGQAELIARVYQLAEVPFSSLGLIEAHGTATVLGDPIEIQALNKVATELLAPDELSRFRCAIGSVKSNMGHLDAAAGVAGLIKAVLSVRFGKIPPSLHFSRPNPHLALDKTPFHVPTQAEDWPAEQPIRRAGVSSFGIGGTNVHVLLEQAPPVASAPAATDEAVLLPLSAQSPAALARLIETWSAHLQVATGPDAALTAIAQQLCQRPAYPSRAAFVSTAGANWQPQLDNWSLLDGAQPQRDQQVWLFPGQGTQSPQMGLQLAERFPEFGELYHRLLTQAEQLLAMPAGQLLDCVRQPEQLSTLQLQPILYALQAALGLWLRRIVGQPVAVCGFSLGEFAAAAVAGVFSAETGMALVVARARLMEAMPRGAVFAASRKKGFDGEFPDFLWPISELSPGTWTLATAEADAAKAEAWLASEGFASKRVAVSHAFHTPLIAPAAQAFGELLRGEALQAAQCDIYSTARGGLLAADAMCQPQYWVEQMLGAVQFGPALKAAEAAHPDSLYLQIGAGGDLLQHARKWLGLPPDRLLPTLGSGGTAQEVASQLQSLGRIWVQGGALDWSLLQATANRDQAPPRSHLPGHAFERRVCPPLRQADAASVESLFFGNRLYGMAWEQVSAPAERVTASDETPATWIISRHTGERERSLAAALGREASTAFIECPSWDGDFGQIDAALQSWLSQQGLRASAAMDVIVTPLLDELSPREAQFWAYWLPLALARWSAAQQPAPRLRLLFPASRLLAWQGTEPVEAEKSQLMGPLLIAAEEYSDLSALCIDFADPAVETIAQALQPWLEHGWVGGQFYCYREQGYWRRRISAAVQAQTLNRALPEISRNSWVLVTGAKGGMGTAIARHLAEVYRCNLLLQVRKPLPARSDWPAHIAQQGPEPDFLQHLLALEQAGSRVIVLEADLADEAALAKSFAPVFRLVERGIALDYVFHTAGRGEGAMIQLRNEAESLATLAPKVTGTRFLCNHHAQLGKPALLLFSSLGNLLPKEKVGQVAYVAANACLEAYAEQVRKQGGKALAIAWDDWAESGMATRSAQQLDQALGQTASAAHEGVIWRRDLDSQRDWWLDEHRLDATTTVMPAMGMLALVHQALLASRSPAMATSLQAIAIERPLVVKVDDALQVVVAFDATFSHFGLYSGRGEFSRETWLKHASGRLREAGAAPAAPDVGATPLQNLFRSADGHGVSPKAALQFGPRWRTVQAVDRLAADVIVSHLQLPAAYAGEAAASDLHVALLDTATLIGSPLEEDAQFAPVSMGGFTRCAPMQDRVLSHVQIADLGSSKLLQVKICSEAGELLVAIDDLLLIDASAALRGDAAAAQQDDATPRHAVMRLADEPEQRASFVFHNRQEARRAPGPQEVEICVKAAGLNFKDVLIAVGVLPAPTDPAMTFGQEAAGIVTRVGSEVTDLQVGDRVMCAGHSCLAEHVIMARRVVAKIPQTLGFQQAAGVPVAFTTAWIALRHAANLRRGERILIHSAAGGVGMAAMQIALHLGAEVWVTAGSEEKRQLLLQMGAKGAAHSRTREFGEVFRQQLGERPFDVILNALAGELLEESVSLLAPQGRFLELGLRDILQNWQLGLSIFAEGGSFHAVQAGAEHPAYSQAWAEVAALLAQETLRPLPTRVYPARDIAEAFRFMAQGKHVGKIVVAMEARAESRGFSAKLREEGLSNAEGSRIALVMAALVRQLAVPYIAVSKLPIGEVLEKQASTQQMLFSSAAPSAEAGVTTAGESSLQGADADTLLQAMQAMLEGFLGVAGLDVDASFFALGATSLDLIQFAKRLEQRLGREIPVALLFKAASLRELSKELAPAAPQAVSEEPAAPVLDDKRRALQARRKLRGATTRQESEVDD
ncbi:type I polyketide synthase [Parachitinimonas caeni]|uniref:Beta-ketoacyl synthase N-terminal-like domain-containing protein n=1 Tax=Parachitinimonas caeni TaxID=3031301 RepID=A0ABT7DTR3_9NEIS|nr:type I polyketide synthase [Parachitinimonas caeni]MDK2123469.1 beta-ketoacyl synthase N-terminal-like domain-containing protein [Parachitinimonas caeni]